MAVALGWVSRITTVALEMVLPGVLGFWLDRQFGTVFLGLVGFALGFVLGMRHLLAMTRSVKPPSRAGGKSDLGDSRR